MGLIGLLAGLVIVGDRWCPVCFLSYLGESEGFVVVGLSFSVYFLAHKAKNSLEGKKWPTAEEKILIPNKQCSL